MGAIGVPSDSGIRARGPTSTGVSAGFDVFSSQQSKGAGMYQRWPSPTSVSCAFLVLFLFLVANVYLLGSLTSVSRSDADAAFHERGRASGDASSEQAAEELLRWVLANNGSLGDVRVGHPPPFFERGLVATNALAEDAFVLTVPVRLLGTLQKAVASPLGRAVLKIIGDRLSHQYIDVPGVLLTAWLLHEQGQTQSFWAAYLSSLPADFPGMPWNFSADARRLCASGMAFETTIETGRQRLRQEFEDIFETLPDSVKKPSWQDFLRARFTTLSRTFSVNRIGLQMDEYLSSGAHNEELDRILARHTRAKPKAKNEAYVLAPLADLLNHGRHTDVNCRWHYGKHGFTIVTHRPVEQGEQLFLSYGEEKSNNVFLADYGFVESGNPNDKVNLTLSLGQAEAGAIKTIAVQITGSAAQDDVIDTVLDVCRDTARNMTSAEATPVSIETLAMRILAEALDVEAGKLAPPAGCPAVCVAFRKNLMALIGTWGNFAKHALAFLGGAAKFDEDDSLPRRYNLLTRLYFGIWLRQTSVRQVFAGDDGFLAASAFGSVRRIDIMDEVGLA